MQEHKIGGLIFASIYDRSLGQWTVTFTEEELLQLIRQIRADKKKVTR